MTVIDDHSCPGGQWFDSYNFVQLHQPSAMYGVKSTRLEPRDDGSYRSTREEILDYYNGVCEMLHSKFDFHFACETFINLDTLEEYGADDEDSDDAERVPEIRVWITNHRLFNSGHLTADEMDTLVKETWIVLEKYDIVQNVKSNAL